MHNFSKMKKINHKMKRMNTLLMEVQLFLICLKKKSNW